MQQEGDAIYLAGDGASPDGDRPFLDRFDLKTLQVRAPVPQRPDGVRVVPRVHRPGHRARFLTWHQSPSDPPNALLRTLGAAVPGAPAGEPAVASTARPDHAHPRSDARGTRHQEAAGQVQAQGRPRALVHPLHAARLQGGHARPGHPLRLPARLRGRVEGRAGHRARSRRSHGCGSTGCCSWPATPSSTTRRSPSWATRRRPTTRTSSSWSPTRRRRSTRPWSSAWSIRSASASRGTATAR